MQYLLIDKNESLQSVSKVVGSQNVDLILAENGLKRTPNIGKQWYDKCADVIANTPNDITGSRKSALLNSLTGSEEAFEKACLMDENEWKVFSAFQSFPDTLRVPESVKLPSSSRVIGDGGLSTATIGNAQRVTKQGQTKQSTAEPVNPVTYKAVMQNLKQSPSIDPGIFNKVNTSPPVGIDASRSSSSSTSQFAFTLPWGKIELYSSLLQESIQFPCYPEEVQTGRSATYTSMPDTIYQYEPWIVYENSGPREQTLTFHMHRDMWSGNHLDGQANKLIRFCEANTFPRYSGSSVLSPIVRMYIDGQLFIAGVMLGTQTVWRGPIGQDNWYLEFELTLTIQEVSDTPLNIDVVSGMKIIGS